MAGGTCGAGLVEEDVGRVGGDLRFVRAGATRVRACGRARVVCGCGCGCAEAFHAHVLGMRARMCCVQCVHALGGWSAPGWWLAPRPRLRRCAPLARTPAAPPSFRSGDCGLFSCIQLARGTCLLVKDGVELAAVD